MITQTHHDLRARIPVALQFGKIRSCYFSVPEFLPVDLLEPRMGKHIAYAIVYLAVAFYWIALHQLENDIRCMGMERRPANKVWPLKDALVEDVGVAIGLVVRREACQHLKYEHPESVPVDAPGIPLLKHDLSRDKVHSAAKYMILPRERGNLVCRKASRSSASTAWQNQSPQS